MKCWYMNGAGNDFMIVDARGLSPDFSHMARKLCDLSGADGFMAVDTSDIADFRLHFYNSDGSRGEMCGNGSRCICRFAYENHIAGPEMTIETDAGLVTGWRVDETMYRVRLNNPWVVDLHRKGDCAYVELGNPGVPHAVLEVPDLEWAKMEPLRPIATALRHNTAFPKGANVNFYRWLDEKTVRMLTYERGVEDYTLACGTGCSSTAVVLWLQGRLPGGVLTAQNRGGTLTVQIQGEQGRVTGVLLEGPTELVRVYDI